MIRLAPQEGRDRPCPYSQTRSGTPSAASSAGRLRIKFHIWLEPLELAAIRGTTVYVRARAHPHLGRRALPPSAARAASGGVGERALVEVVGDDWQPPAADERPGPGGGAAGTNGHDRHADRLNPKYSFDQFVIGAGNRFAHAATLSVAELPGHSNNPLFLYGSPGIGKTHLLHAVGNYVERFGSGLEVRYATIEEFTSEFVEAARRNQTAGFKQRFRGADVVLIDDVQFLAGLREDARGVLPACSTRCIDAGRQLVMIVRPRAGGDPGYRGAPDRAVPVRARGRGRTRPSSGCAWRSSPSARAARRDPGEPGTCWAEIAGRVTTSVRALEGALIRVVAYASMQRRAAHTLSSSATCCAGSAPTRRPTPAASTRSSR